MKVCKVFSMLSAVQGMRMDSGQTVNTTKPQKKTSWLKKAAAVGAGVLAVNSLNDHTNGNNINPKIRAVQRPETAVQRPEQWTLQEWTPWSSVSFLCDTDSTETRERTYECSREQCLGSKPSKEVQRRNKTACRRNAKKQRRNAKKKRLNAEKQRANQNKKNKKSQRLNARNKRDNQTPPYTGGAQPTTSTAPFTFLIPSTGAQPPTTKPTTKPTTQPTTKPQTTKPTTQPVTTKPQTTQGDDEDFDYGISGGGSDETTKPTTKPTTQPTTQPQTTQPTTKPTTKPTTMPVPVPDDQDGKGPMGKYGLLKIPETVQSCLAVDLNDPDNTKFRGTQSYVKNKCQHHTDLFGDSINKFGFALYQFEQGGYVCVSKTLRDEIIKDVNETKTKCNNPRSFIIF